jgi:hypothetical protein
MTITESAIASGIAAGSFDSELKQIIEAAKNRQQQIRSARTVADFGIGDTVRFNDYCATKYLHGHQAAVIGFRGKKLLVKLKNPIGKHAVCVDGKWEGSEVVVPPSIVDLVN